VSPSLSRWRTSRFRETSSPTSWGSSPSCGHLPRQQHEAFGVTGSSKTTGEVCLDDRNLAANRLRRRAETSNPHRWPTATLQA
jgi:hypothetical protein